MLGQLLSKIDLSRTTVVMCSDHGFHPDHLRPRAIPKEPAGPAVEHREHGMFLIAGPGIRRDHLIHGATLLDVTPTVLAVFGLQIGEDTDGEPLTDCFEAEPELQWVESWDSIDGEHGRHPEGKTLGGSDHAETMQQLVDPGDIDKPQNEMLERPQHYVRRRTVRCRGKVDDELRRQGRSRPFGRPTDAKRTLQRTATKQHGRRCPEPDPEA